MTDILIALALLLDSLIEPFTVEPTKANLQKWSKDLTPAFVAMGYKPIKFDTYFENFPIRGAAGVPYWQYNDWCGYYFALTTKYKYVDDPYYGTVDMVWVTAHEMAHGYQGVSCNMSTSETDASLMGMAALSNTEGEIYEQALIWQLREFALIRAVDESCKEGRDLKWMDDLSKDTLDLYANTKCWMARTYRPYTNAIPVLLDSKGSVDGQTMPEINVDNILEIITTSEK